MSKFVCKGSDVRQYIAALPKEQILHSAHVRRYVSVFARIIFDCGLDLPEVAEYKLFGDAAYYHDIGKEQISNEILLKPGRLTQDEFHIVRKHPLYAKELFDLIDRGVISGMQPQLIRMAREAAVYHHEWWNGMGYPYGLSHDDIPLIARITSVCDVYDAITSDRAYRKAHHHEFACHEIEANAGIQFDPALVKLFLHQVEPRFFKVWTDLQIKT